ncbi:MAG: hypothetical protein KatS3mg111_3564 [Pirellulaceae bacterium]|nr:MAG: hypothetical protein KatS3mg111_3564 [Pirellulaceae bacterium]
MATAINYWKQSGGNWLLGLSVVAAILASLSFRFGWIPEIRLSPPPRAATSMVQRPTGILAVTVLVPREVALPGEDIVAWAVPTVGRLHDGQTISVAARTKLTSAGVATLVLQGVPLGSQAAVAFIDRNGNGRLDIDHASGVPTEPFRISRLEDDGPEDPLDLDSAELEISADGPTIVLLDFAER